MKLVELYDGTLFECQMIKNLLENEDIESFLKDIQIGTRGGSWNPRGGVKVMVSDLDFEKSKLVVKAFEESRHNQ